MANSLVALRAGSLLSVLILPLLFIGLSSVFFFNDLLAINDIWLNNHSYDTGYPVLGICLLFSYLTQTGKSSYSWQPPNSVLLTALLLAIVFYILTNLLTMQGPRLLAYVLIFIFFIAINTHRSQRLNKILVFGLLLYVIPIWGVITPILQTLTVKTTSFGLQLAHIPAIIHGNYISLPGGTLEVEEGCSGLRYLVTTLLICHIFCLLNTPNFKGWVLMFLSGSVLALIANWLRVYILSHVAYITDLQHPWMHDHAALGWAVYAIIYIPLYFLSGSIMSHCKIQRDFSFSSLLSKTSRESPLVALLFSLLIISIPYGQTYFKSLQPLDDILFTQPDDIALCYKSDDNAALTPNYTGYDRKISTTYDCTSGKVYTHQLVYRQQQQGKELINVFNSLLDETQWREVDDIHISQPLDFSIHQFVNDKGDKALIAYTYLIGDKVSTSNQVIRKEMIRKGLFKEVPAAMIATSMYCKNNCEPETAFLERFFSQWGQSTFN